MNPMLLMWISFSIRMKAGESIKAPAVFGAGAIFTCPVSGLYQVSYNGIRRTE